jgi:hypothetical protein
MRREQQVAARRDARRVPNETAGMHLDLAALVVDGSIAIPPSKAQCRGMPGPKQPHSPELNTANDKTENFFKESEISSKKHGTNSPQRHYVICDRVSFFPASQAATPED